RHTRSYGDWSSDVCSSDLFSSAIGQGLRPVFARGTGGGRARAAAEPGGRLGERGPVVREEAEERGLMGGSVVVRRFIASRNVGKIGRASCRERAQIALGGV